MTSYHFKQITFPSGGSYAIEGDTITRVSEPTSTALPCPAGFSAFRSPDMGSSSHLVEWVHGTAHR